VTPGACRELYNILDLPKFIDSTYTSSNTLRFSPNAAFNISSIRETRTVAVKNIQDSFLTNDLYSMKIESVRIDIE